MMMLLLMAGVGALLGGLVAVAFGIPVKEFSFGNTLIVAGAMAACTGLIMIGLSVVVGELKLIARRLASRNHAEARSRMPFQGAGSDDDFSFSGDQSTVPDADDLEPAVAPPPPVLPRMRQDTPAAPGPAEPALSPASTPRRNLIFAAASRKERQRQPRPVVDLSPPAPLTPPPIVDLDEPQPPGFDNGWAKPERARGPDLPPVRRAGRPMLAEQSAGVAFGPGRNADQPTVTVLKSGVVDGMAYSLYSDGSIEAQLPEGTMRFGSIDELRTHLDQRSG
jgi:hypothetical protein